MNIPNVESLLKPFRARLSFIGRKVKVDDCVDIAAPYFLALSATGAVLAEYALAHGFIEALENEEIPNTATLLAVMEYLVSISEHSETIKGRMMEMGILAQRTGNGDSDLNEISLFWPDNPKKV